MVKVTPDEHKLEGQGSQGSREKSKGSPSQEESTMCCCIPCFKSLQRKFDPVPGSGPFTLLITEIIRWLVIIGPLYLSVWRYAELEDCYSFDLSTCPHTSTGIEPNMGEYWGIVSAIILGGSLFLYLPLKIFALKWRMSNNQLKDHRWRPSILVYIMVCALPSLVLIMVAVAEDRQEDSGSTLDATTTTVLQVMVLGLTFTEWMSKLREEVITFDLITAMSQDFFFAYDVIQFLMMCTYEPNIFHSDWFFVCFTFAFVAMFKYIPTQPTNISQTGAPKGAAITILVSMFCVDIPFVVVRLWTMIKYGLIVSDLIHPIKNVALICFGCTQLWIIYANYRALMKARAEEEANAERKRMVVVAEERKSRYPVCVWSKEHGAMICTWQDDSDVPRVSRDVEIAGGIDETDYWDKQRGKDNNAFQLVPPADYDDKKAQKRKSKRSNTNMSITEVEEIDK